MKDKEQSLKSRSSVRDSLSKLALNLRYTRWLCYLMLTFCIIMIIYSWQRSILHITGKFLTLEEWRNNIISLVTPEESSTVAYKELLKGPTSLAQDDPKLTQVIRKHFLEPPSAKKYHLSMSQPEYSKGQAAEIRKLLHNKRDGFFIESGAYDGEFTSNSLVFERDYGWQGALIEPDPVKYKRLLSKHRKAWTIQSCLSPDTYPSKYVFHRHGVGSAIAKYSHKNQVDNEGFVEVQCLPLYSILLALNRSKIDYFSLDVEGVEFHVLKTIPWDKVNITTISVEIQFLGKDLQTLVDYMKKQGYEFLKKVLIDYIFFHPKLLSAEVKEVKEY